jgi:hypothetical protein
MLRRSKVEPERCQIAAALADYRLVASMLRRELEQLVGVGVRHLL